MTKEICSDYISAKCKPSEKRKLDAIQKKYKFKTRGAAMRFLINKEQDD